MNAIPKHKVFVSFHHEDQGYKKKFVDMMKGDIVDKSVEDGDIDDTRSSTETIRQKIRDEFIRDATVTVVLIGPCTWQRKHVDWEIGSSLRDTHRNSRCGLLGILLPNHANYRMVEYNPSLIPPRLADNCGGKDPFARICRWSYNSQSVSSWVKHVRFLVNLAFERRSGTPPNNGRAQFGRNRGGECLKGWTD